MRDLFTRSFVLKTLRVYSFAQWNHTGCRYFTCFNFVSITDFGLFFIKARIGLRTYLMFGKAIFDFQKMLNEWTLVDGKLYIADIRILCFRICCLLCLAKEENAECVIDHCSFSPKTTFDRADKCAKNIVLCSGIFFVKSSFLLVVGYGLCLTEGD